MRGRLATLFLLGCLALPGPAHGKDGGGSRKVGVFPMQLLCGELVVGVDADGSPLTAGRQATAVLASNEGRRPAVVIFEYDGVGPRGVPKGRQQGLRFRIDPGESLTLDCADLGLAGGAHAPISLAVRTVPATGVRVIATYVPLESPSDPGGRCAAQVLPVAGDLVLVPGGGVGGPFCSGCPETSVGICCGTPTICCEGDCIDGECRANDLTSSDDDDD